MFRYDPYQPVRESSSSLPPLHQPVVPADTHEYAAPLGMDPGGYTPPPPWTETDWPGTPTPPALPLVQDTVGEPPSTPAYEDAAIAQRLIDEVLIDRFAETDPYFASGVSQSLDAAIDAPAATNETGTASTSTVPVRNGPLDLGESELELPMPVSGLEEILEEENEPQPIDPITLLASGGIFGLGPNG